MSAFVFNPVTLATLDIMGRDEEERIKRMRNAWLRYQGDWPDPLKRQMGTPNYNLKANFAREFVDKSVAKLFGDAVEFELDRETRKRNPDEAYLDQVWAQNKKQTLLQKVAKNGGVTGHVFVMIEPPNPEKGRAFPRFVNLEPEIVFPTIDDFDVDEVLGWRIQYNSVERRNGDAVPVTKRKLIEPDGDVWIIRDFISYTEQVNGAGPGVWIQRGQEVWPWAFSPIVHNQNLPAPNVFWGTPDLTDDRLDLMHGYNMLISNVNKIVFFDAHKRRYVTGFTGDQADLKEWNIEQIKGFPEGAEVKSVEGGADIAQVLDFQDRIKDLLHEQSNVPAVSVGKVDGLGQLSGVALEILYEPLLEMTRIKRGTYGDMLVELNQRVLWMADRDGDQDVHLQWARELPEDEKAVAETAQLWQGMGVSEDTLMERGGFDPDRERKRREASDAEFGARLIERQMAGGDAMAVEDDE